MSEIIFLQFKPGAKAFDWRFIDPCTGFKYKANSKSELIRTIITYRVNNRLEPIENLDMVVDEYLCRQPENSGLCRPTPLIKRGLYGFLRGGIMILKTLLFQSFASQEVADARAKVCVGCPNNIFPNKKSYIRWADGLAEASTRGKKSKHHNELGNCSICSCCMRAKVWIGKDILEVPKEELDAFPDFCWQKKEVLEKNK